jgi:hypothetical protein
MKVLMLGGSSSSRSAPTAMSRSINTRVGSSCRDCAVLGPPQLSTSTLQVRLVGMGADGKSQGSCAHNLWWFQCIWLHIYFNSWSWSLGNWKAFSGVDTRNRLIMKTWPLVVKAHRGNHWGFLFTKDHASIPIPDASASPEVFSDDLLHPREGWYRATEIQSQFPKSRFLGEGTLVSSTVFSLTCAHTHSQLLNILCLEYNFN